ncbi:MAG: hypothetical protein MJ211_04160 [Bacteroidales bacterium]|nr:hypothetical protein [Bacteroidales bacterium]
MINRIFIGTFLTIKQRVAGIVVSYSSIQHISKGISIQGHELRILDKNGVEYFLIMFEKPIYQGNEFNYDTSVMLVKQYYNVENYNAIHLDWGKEIIQNNIGNSNYKEKQRFDFNYYYDTSNKYIFIERYLEDKINLRYIGEFVYSSDIFVGNTVNSFPLFSKTYIEGEPIKRNILDINKSNNIGEILIKGDTYNVLNSGYWSETKNLGNGNANKTWREFALQHSGSGDFCRLSILDDKCFLWKTSNSKINTQNLTQISDSEAINVNTNRTYTFKEFAMPNNDGIISLENHSSKNSNDVEYYIGKEYSFSDLKAVEGNNNQNLSLLKIENRYVMEFSQIEKCTNLPAIYKTTTPPKYQNKNSKTSNFLAIGVVIFHILILWSKGC